MPDLHAHLIEPGVFDPFRPGGLSPKGPRLAKLPTDPAKSAADLKVTRCVDLYRACHQGFRIGLADTESSSAATRPASATKQLRGAGRGRDMNAGRASARAQDRHDRSLDPSGQLGRDQEVAQAEAALVSRQCRRPVRIDHQVGLGIAGNDPNQHVADDPSANRPELLAVVLDR